jgi:hypothetical protein
MVAMAVAASIAGGQRRAHVPEAQKLLDDIARIDEIFWETRLAA